MRPILSLSINNVYGRKGNFCSLPPFEKESQKGPSENRVNDKKY